MKSTDVGMYMDTLRQRHKDDAAQLAKLVKLAEQRDVLMARCAEVEKDMVALIQGGSTSTRAASKGAGRAAPKRSRRQRNEVPIHVQFAKVFVSYKNRLMDASTVVTRAKTKGWKTSSEKPNGLARAILENSSWFKKTGKGHGNVKYQLTAAGLKGVKEFK